MSEIYNKFYDEFAKLQYKQGKVELSRRVCQMSIP